MVTKFLFSCVSSPFQLSHPSNKNLLFDRQYNKKDLCFFIKILSLLSFICNVWNHYKVYNLRRKEIIHKKNPDLPAFFVWGCKSHTLDFMTTLQPDCWQWLHSPMLTTRIFTQHLDVLWLIVCVDMHHKIERLINGWLGISQKCWEWPHYSTLSHGLSIL